MKRRSFFKKAAQSFALIALAPRLVGFRSSLDETLLTSKKRIVWEMEEWTCVMVPTVIDFPIDEDESPLIF